MLGKLKESIFGKRMPREEAFRLFKDVLEDHNRGLETIADMGEKLGGEFLFDVNYVRPAYTKLFTEVSGCIEKFGLLTRGKYAKLADALARIDARVRVAVDEVETASGSSVIFHEDITWETEGEVGGKNANVAAVRNLLGLKTPEGFALTFRAFDLFMQGSGLEGPARELEEAASPSAEELAALRQRVRGSELPASLSGEIAAAVGRMAERVPGGFTLAVRSSAEDEDSDTLTFAGIYDSVLGVAPDPAPVEAAYKQVVASLFTEKAFAYRRERGVTGPQRMAVCCMAMVDAAAAGVAYSTAPSGKPEVLISASFGLGSTVVDGSVDPDRFTVARDEKGGLSVTGRHIGEKAFKAVEGESGLARKEIPSEERSSPSLTDEKVLALASLAVRIEGHFRRPQDIEWALGKDGHLYILQARPLRTEDRANPEVSYPSASQDAEVLLEGRGAVVQHGVAAGPVFVVRREQDIAAIPKGAVVVSGTDSPNLVRAMSRLSAILTGTGSATSHMAALCREFRVPCAVGLGDALKALHPGDVVTFRAGDDGFSVYRGVVRELLYGNDREAYNMEALHEYRKKRQLLRFISALNLLDPQMAEFTPERCRTMHDLLRFVHEKSVAELMGMAMEGARRGEKTVRLELSIPAGIMVMDIGGALSGDVKDKAALSDVASAPLKALLTGMTHPGMWRSEAVPLKVGDLLSSMIRMPEIADGGSHTDLNLAVASREYVNLSMKFGYHFNMLDCYLSGNPRDTHIHFRFSGGATDMTKRSRRVRLLSRILTDYGLATDSKGDLIIARISGLPREEAVNTLEMLGRLISYSRQLDAVLNSEDDVEVYAQRFKEA